MSALPLQPLALPLHGSRLIEASAGTGKTFTIAFLYVRLVLNHGGDQAFGRPLTPPEILVVTFTDAATQELRERIRGRLSEAARCFAEPTGMHDPLLVELRDSYPASTWPGAARLLQLAAEWMDESAISTIHSWCLRILREHAFDSGSLFNQALITDQAELLGEAVRDYWRRNFYPLDEGAARAVQECFAGPDALLRQLQPLLNAQHSLFHYAEQPLEVPASLKDSLARAGDCYAALEAAEAQARSSWAASADDLRALFYSLRGQLNGTTYKGKDDEQKFQAWLEALYAWSQGEEAPKNLAKFGQSRIKLKAHAKMPQHPALQALDEYLNQLEQLPQDLRPKLLLHAWREVRSSLEAEKRKRAELTFDDLLKHLDQALSGPTGESLAERIRSQFPVALIDEFQDTDPLQYRIFQRIYLSPELDQRRLGLFLIGDPKQAIYGFRGADIYTYLEARRTTQGRHYTLTTNYRSTQAMVRAVNRCFGFAETHPRGAFRFAGSDHENPLPFLQVTAKGRSESLWLNGQPAAAMTFWQLDTRGEVCTFSEYRQEMAKRCATAIQRWLSQPQGSGLRNADGSWRPLRPSDIAILVRGRREAEGIRSALAQRRLSSVYLSDRDSVFATREAADLLHWLRACADPSDGQALRSALATHSLGQDWQSFERLNQDEHYWESQLLRFRDYQRLWRQQGVLPMLRRLLADFQLPARLLQQNQGERRLTNLLHLAEWLQREAVELDGEHALLRALAEQLEHPDREEILRLESDANLIRVVTIHKSKGLEYPLVLLPFICTWQDPNKQPSYQQGQTRVIDLADEKLAKQAYAKARDERLSEDMRLLYVALTRARYGVWLGVAPLVLGRFMRKPELHNSALGYLLGGDAEFTVENLPSRLSALQQGHAEIALEPAPPNQYQDVPSDQEEPLGPARRTSRRMAEKWWIASYSALADLTSLNRLSREQEPSSAGEDWLREGIRQLAPAEQSEPLPFSCHAFPQGPQAGSFLHALLEWAAERGFARCDRQSLRDQLARRCQLPGWEDWIEPLTDWLMALLNTEFVLPDAAPLRLAGLQRYQTEMEFWFATRRLNTQQLDLLLNSYTLDGLPRPSLQSNQLNGLFKGFIDLVFEHQGRYYVADYKSNWLGANDQAYTPEAMRASMLAQRYDLQYSLYLFALHRLLQARLPGYDYQRHLGGALYLFLRGSGSASQGLYLERPPLALMEALDELFRGVEHKP